MPVDLPAGECPVIYLSHTAAGTPGLEYAQLHIVLHRHSEGQFRPFPEFHVPAGAVLFHRPATAYFNWWPGDGTPSHHFRTYREHFMSLQKLQDMGVPVAAAVIFAAAAKQAGADKHFHLRQSTKCISSNRYEACPICSILKSRYLMSREMFLQISGSKT